MSSWPSSVPATNERDGDALEAGHVGRACQRIGEPVELRVYCVPGVPAVDIVVVKSGVRARPDGPDACSPRVPRCR